MSLVCAGYEREEEESERERERRGKETRKERERQHKGNCRERQARTMTAGSLVHSLAHARSFIRARSSTEATDLTHKLTDQMSSNRPTDRQPTTAREKTEEGRKDETSENCMHIGKKAEREREKGGRSRTRKGQETGRTSEGASERKK